VSLRETRAKGEVWDPRFYERDPRFAPIAEAARVFRDRIDWPMPEEYVPAGGVRFVSMKKPRRARNRAPVDPENMYDACILRGVVPTRPRCWHDFLNALVWATFPNAKRALHERQAELVRAWVTPGAKTLPNARSREHDALAMIDEGGVIVLDDRTIAFGHALYEGLVFGTPAMIARAVRLEDSDVDRALAMRLRDKILPEDLPRFSFVSREVANDRDAARDGSRDQREIAPT